jgi:hypothetical protein
MITTTPREPARARFRLLVETASGQAGVHALRHALKLLGRSYGVRVVDAVEVDEPEREQDKAS